MASGFYRVRARAWDAPPSQAGVFTTPFSRPGGRQRQPRLARRPHGSPVVIIVGLAADRRREPARAPARPRSRAFGAVSSCGHPGGGHQRLQPQRAARVRAHASRATDLRRAWDDLDGAGGVRRTARGGPRGGRVRLHRVFRATAAGAIGLALLVLAVRDPRHSGHPDINDPHLTRGKSRARSLPGRGSGNGPNTNKSQNDTRQYPLLLSGNGRDSFGASLDLLSEEEWCAHQQREGKDVSEMRRVVARSGARYTLLELIIAIV